MVSVYKRLEVEKCTNFVSCTMHFEQGNIYHVYNRSNETVFFSEENYMFFLNKVRRFIYPNCDILAWCLMPNHFHFLIYANSKSIESTKENHRPSLQVLSKNFGTLLSSYTQSFNRFEKRKRKGRLFSHNTVAKLIEQEKDDYLENCFFYIHQNPLRAHLVSKLENWEFSSFRDSAGFRNGTLCNENLAFQLIKLDSENFYEQSYAVIDEKYLDSFRFR